MEGRNMMERLTKRTKTGGVLMASEHEEKYTTEEWICMLQDRLADCEDTGLTPERVVWMKEVIEIAFDHDKSRAERLRELAAADKEGRVVVLPFTSGRTLLCEENIDCMRLMKDVGLAIRYCSSAGIVFYMGYNMFCDLVKHGRITAVSEEAERMMEGKKDGNETSM